MARNGSTSPWVWVGCGCGAAALIAVAAVVGLFVWGTGKAKQLEEELKDPDSRRDRVLGVLGGEIPEGYYPVMGMEVPFLMEMAMLGDNPPNELGEIDDPIGDRGFIYLRVRSGRDKRERLDDFFEGRTNDLDALRQSNIDLGRGEVIDRGSFDLERFAVRWVAQRGEVSMGRGRSEGLTALSLFECPGEESSAQRIGIWFGPEPEVAEEGGEVDLTGTPADEEAIKAFLGHFAPCG